MGAKKCTKCDSFQDWRRYLPLGQNVLALLVALVSVVTLGVPVFKDAFKKDASDIKVNFQSAGPSTITLLASNTGMRSGGIGGSFILTITYEGLNRKPEHLFYTLVLKTDAPPF
jgi:hypothetical protein